VFKAVEPGAFPQGTRVRLIVEEETGAPVLSRRPKIRTPMLARHEDAADFVMEVRESGEDARSATPAHTA